MKTISIDLDEREMTLESGLIAKQADGSVTLQLAESLVLVTVVADKRSKTQKDFIPLTCDYIERPSSAGRIPGGFFRREGRMGEKEVLTSRLVDRPIRPLLAKGWGYETQVIATVLSSDGENDTAIIAMTAASAAMHISDIPFDGPFAAVRVGRIDGEFIVNPTRAQRDVTELDLIVVWKEDALVMVEGGANIVPEDIMLDAIMFAKEQCLPQIKAQHELREALGKPKREHTPPQRDEELYAKVKEYAYDKMYEAVQIKAKLERYAAVDALSDECIEHFCSEDDEDAPSEKVIGQMAHDLNGDILRKMVIEEKKRIDGRAFDEVRPITCKVGVLPRTHGSALFTRGETQGLVSTTLGTTKDAQKIESLLGDRSRRFMLHYNFPPFSVGEVKRLGSPNRREIGHGTLARRALKAVIPSEEVFPYTIRVVSDILESNGSSSMATVCGGCLSLMDVGAPIIAPVAGIAMGLVKEGDEIAVLSDILGDEDHLGDMDFKVCGTSEGVTALQMDIKIGGLSEQILRDAMAQAKEGRLHILGKMAEEIEAPRKTLSKYAPRISVIFIPPERIKDIIGPGGKHIKAIQEESGCKLDVDDTGQVQIASPDGESAKKAILKIRALTQEPEAGRFYMGTVKGVKDFGAFVEILPGVEGLLHISQLDNERVNNVEDVVRIGDEVVVKVLEVDRNGKIRLSRKEALGKKVELANQMDEEEI